MDQEEEGDLQEFGILQDTKVTDRIPLGRVLEGHLHRISRIMVYPPGKTTYDALNQAVEYLDMLLYPYAMHSTDYAASLMKMENWMNQRRKEIHNMPEENRSPILIQSTSTVTKWKLRILMQLMEKAGLLPSRKI